MIFLVTNARLYDPRCNPKHHYDNEDSGKNDAPDDLSITAFQDAISVIYVAVITSLSVVAVIVLHTVVGVGVCAWIYSCG